MNEKAIQMSPPLASLVEYVPCLTNVKHYNEVKLVSRVTRKVYGSLILQALVCK